MTDIDDIVKAHLCDKELYKATRNKAALEILDRESALIAKVRELEKELCEANLKIASYEFLDGMEGDEHE